MNYIITIRLNEHLYDKLEKYCQETKRPRSNAVAFMIDQYLEELWNDN